MKNIDLRALKGKTFEFIVKDGKVENAMELILKALIDVPEKNGLFVIQGGKKEKE